MKQKLSRTDAEHHEHFLKLFDEKFGSAASKRPQTLVETFEKTYGRKASASLQETSDYLSAIAAKFDHVEGLIKKVEEQQQREQRDVRRFLENYKPANGHPN